MGVLNFLAPGHHLFDDAVVRTRHVAEVVEALALLVAQGPADAAHIIGELLHIAGTDDRRGDTGAVLHPVKRDLRHRFADFFGDSGPEPSVEFMCNW